MQENAGKQSCGSPLSPMPDQQRDDLPTHSVSFARLTTESRWSEVNRNADVLRLGVGRGPGNLCRLTGCNMLCNVYPVKRQPAGPDSESGRRSDVKDEKIHEHE
jgi:hypothetical protein